jgi:hypothetical protein
MIPAVTSSDGLFRAAVEGRVPPQRLLVPRRRERVLQVTPEEYEQLADALDGLFAAARGLNTDAE